MSDPTGIIKNRSPAQFCRYDTGSCVGNPKRRIGDLNPGGPLNPTALAVSFPPYRAGAAMSAMVRKRRPRMPESRASSGTGRGMRGAYGRAMATHGRAMPVIASPPRGGHVGNDGLLTAAALGRAFATSGYCNRSASPITGLQVTRVCDQGNRNGTGRSGESEASRGAGIMTHATSFAREASGRDSEARFAQANPYSNISTGKSTDEG